MNVPEKVRILYHYSHHHFDTGSPKSLVGMIDILDRKLFDPFFLATHQGPLLTVLSNKGVKIIQATVSKINIARPFKAIKNTLLILRLLKKHKISLVHLNEFSKNLNLCFAAKLAKIPVILHIHNPETIQISNFHRYLADKIILVSNAVANSVKFFHRIKNKCTVIYNSADIEAVENGRSIRESFGLNSEDIIIGTIAQLTPEKGTDIIIETAKLMLNEYKKNIYFLLAGRTGEGCEVFVEQMKSICSQGALTGKVYFLGIRNDIPDLLNSIDLFFLPTKAETFCLAIVEAMAAGLPIVSTAVGSLPELIQQPELGILVPPNLATPQHFSKEIIKLLESKNKGRIIGQAAKASLIGRLDKATCGEKLNKLYFEIVPKRLKLKLDKLAYINS